MLSKIILGWVLLIVVHTYKQNDFVIVLDHWEFHGYNKMRMNYIYVKNVKPNRTYKAVNFDFSNKRDFISDQFKVHIQAFQFLHNEYRQTPIIFDVKVCDALERKLFGIDSIMSTNGNLTKCPLKKNAYYIHNFNFDETAWPPHFPRGRYQIKFTFKEGDVWLAAVSWFGSVEDILRY